ncbi:MAG: molybdopterin-dependent oxidoreductase, partial [Anaerolineae bacterium]
VHSVQGCEITTLEGLGTVENLHPLQEAFLEEGAVQCGFCTPGMILTAKALLDRNPNPADAEIRAEMEGNLCRCGVHDRVLKAIHRASGQPVESPAYTVQDRGEELPSVPQSPPNTLAKTPDLDAWVRVNPDGTITLFTGKVELGQDLKTSIAMIGADELDVSLERIRVVTADTAQSPDEGYTVSSMSLDTSGNAIRYATAEVRHRALSVAHEALEVPRERLTVTDGTIADPVTGRSTTYWDLFAGQPFGGRVTGAAPPKGPDAYWIVGRPAERLDVLAKVTGTARFVHDLDLPGMVHGRVVRPPAYGARLLSADEGAVAQMPGVVQVVRDGSFLAVVAEREEQAVQAMEALRETATWETDADTALPSHETLFEHLLAQPDQAFLVVDGRPVEDPIPPIETPAGAAQTLAATYYRPYHMHASLGPSAAVAQLVEGKLTVWTHSQGVYPFRAALAQVLRMPEEDIRAIHVQGPGCYGHNGADDAALDAALLARAVPGRPVSLKWTRADEHTWEPYGAAAVIQMQASLDAGGDVVDWNHDVWGYTHLGRARAFGKTSGLLVAWYLAEPFKRPTPRPSRGPHVGIHRNADPLYAFPRRRVVKHFVPDSPLRTSTLRGLGSYANVFAIESFMDELAHAAGIDPVEFRLRQIPFTPQRVQAALRSLQASEHSLGA